MRAAKSAFACARSNAGARHVWVMAEATFAAKAAHAWCCTGSVRRSGNASCSPATSRSTPHCRQDRSFQTWPIRGCTSVRRAAFTGYFMPTARFTVAPDYPRRPFASKDQACQWVGAFVNWYNHRHRHSGITFVTSQQRHDGQAVEISRHRTVVYKRARQLNPRHWTRSTRCWRQPVVVWINQQPDELNEPEPLRLVQAA